MLLFGKAIWAVETLRTAFGPGIAPWYCQGSGKHRTGGRGQAAGLRIEVPEGVFEEWMCQGSIDLSRVRSLDALSHRRLKEVIKRCAARRLAR